MTKQRFLVWEGEMWKPVTSDNFDFIAQSCPLCDRGVTRQLKRHLMLMHGWSAKRAIKWCFEHRKILGLSIWYNYEKHFYEPGEWKPRA